MFSYPVSFFAVFWFHCGDSNYSWSFPGYGDHLCSVLKCSPPFLFVFPFIDSASHIHAKAVSSFWWRLVTHESWIVKHGFGIRGQQTDLFFIPISAVRSRSVIQFKKNICQVTSRISFERMADEHLKQDIFDNGTTLSDFGPGSAGPGSGLVPLTYTLERASTTFLLSYRLLVWLQLPCLLLLTA